MRIFIKGGRVVDPGSGIDSLSNLLIDNGIIIDINAGSELEADKIINAHGCIVCPGLIDMHVHLREPGQEYKETIASGSKAAAYGGFTDICCMPNTKPVNDNVTVTKYILDMAKKANFVRVHPVAAISPDLKGKGLCEFGDLLKAGAIAFSDDGMPVMNSQLMRRALEYVKGFDSFIISHCEDLHLSEGGCMNEGELSTQMGLAGIPNASESIMVMRDIALAQLTDSHVHIAHVSTAESVDAIRNAKKIGVNVTCETTPHYFTLTEDAVKEYNTKAKMNPPLRTEFDKKEIIKGLEDGTIDVIVTDHAPHSVIEKDVEFDLAANGIVGLETSLPLSLKLMDESNLGISEIIEKMSCAPARILKLNNKGICTGNCSDITIIDPNLQFTVNTDKFQSKSHNTPFDKWEMKGKAVLTMVEGRIVYDEITKI